MDLQLRRDRGRLPRSGLFVSGVLHAAVITVLLWVASTRPPPQQFETFQMTIVANTNEPEVELATDDLIVDTPDPSPPEPPEIPPPDPEPEPEVDETPPPDPEPEPEVEETPPPPDEVETNDNPAPEPDAVPTEEEVEETGSNVDVRLEGLQRDFPVYYANIVQQISNCFRPPRGNRRLEAVIYFEIRSDGTVSGVRPVQRSGSQIFDLAAIGAIADCAGRRFGALPEELPYETLPVQFSFRPSGIGR